MEGKEKLLELYKRLAALKRQHGEMQEHIEATLESIEEELDISHPDSMLLRHEAYETYRVCEAL